jgi:thioredoxin 1
MNNKRNKRSLMIALMALIAGLSAQGQEANGKTLQVAFPGLTSGALAYAKLGDLPENVLLKSGDVQVTTQDLDSELSGVDTAAKEQLQRNKLFLLENLSTRKLLLQSARSQGATGQSASAPEKELIQKFLEGVVSGAKVSDEEVTKFYEENKDMCGGASLDQMRDQLKDYVLGQKKQDAVTEYVRTIGQRTPIVLAARWVEQQAKLALDNPVDRARSSGKPSLVDFGSTGCRPCDMMAPILEKMKSTYEGKLNIYFVHVGKEQVLASRYGIQSIPVQIFFDKDGKEVYRHTGFFAQAEIEKKLAGIGVQ